MLSGPAGRRVLAINYGAGSLVCALSLLPGWVPTGHGVLAAVGLQAGVTSAVLFRLRRLPVAVAHVLLAAGSVLITLVVASAGGGSSSAALCVFSIFIVSYAAMFFRGRAASAHVLWSLLGVGVALFAAEHSAATVLHLTTVLGITMISTGVGIHVLVARIVALAITDPVTGLYNERGFCEESARIVEAATTAAPTALLLVQIDSFSEIRDVLGSALSDDLLRQVGQRHQSHRALEHGITARVGRGTFALLLPGLPPGVEAVEGPALLALTSTIAQAARGPYAVGGIEIDATVTVGIAVAPQHGSDIGELLRRATAALSAARLDGIPAQVWTHALDLITADTLHLQAQLSRGIAQGQLRLVYQPLVAAHTGSMVGVEALVRWQHPKLGLLPPGGFLPQAERSPVIVELTIWVLEEAVRQAAYWHRLGTPLPVSVNFSARLLAHDGLASMVADVLARHGLPAGLLTVEVTESAVVLRPTAAAAVLAEVRALGARISFDDFGTGYTSLALLADLPLDELKVDQRFISGALERTGDAAIVRAVVQLGHRLGLHVVGEGVEDEATRRLLAELDYDVLQGYLFSRPVAADTITEMARQQLAGRPVAPVVAPVLPEEVEQARLAALRSYDVLDTDREAFFDDVATVAAYICGTPIALISLVDAERQWFKASYGVNVAETPRDQSFCAHSVPTGAMLEVADATVDSRFADNPLVTGELGLRFYAGAPLITPSGHVLGNLCVVDRKAHTLSGEQRVALHALARSVVAHLELRSGRPGWAATLDAIPAPATAPTGARSHS